MERLNHNFCFVAGTLLSAVLFVGCGTNDESMSNAMPVGVDQDSTDVQTAEGPAELPQSIFETVTIASLEQQIQKIANSHLNSLKGSLMTPQWTDQATYDNEVRVLYRPDVEGPAYYELAVNQGGFVIVSNGPHDDPVPHFSSEGYRITDILLSQAEQHGKLVARFYKLDVLVYVAEDVDGNIVASVGPNGLETLQNDSRTRSANPVDEVGSWKELKSEYRHRFATKIDRIKKEVAPVWNALADDTSRQHKVNKRVTPGDEGIVVSQAEWIPHSELIKKSSIIKSFPTSLTTAQPVVAQLLGPLSPHL